MEYQELEKNLHQYPLVYLYGAGVVAYGAYKAVQELFDITVQGFLVTDRGGQPDKIEGIAVHSLKEIEAENSRIFILIATPEEYHSSIEQTLEAARFFHHMRLDSHMEYLLMGNYLKKIRNLKLIEDLDSYLTGGIIQKNCDSVGVYMAVSHKDRPLDKQYDEKAWVKKVQAGAALTQDKLCGITDDGFNGSLSMENELYGELTVTNYVWKHSKYSITGLFHYRRILKVSEAQISLLDKGLADVILPLPFVCCPDASGQYGRYLLKQDIDIMRKVLQEQEREHFREIQKILSMPYLYNYNMLIARKEVFEDYCAWMFPILKEVACRCEKERRNRMPRYIGRIGEVLTSIYFMRNVKGWKIVHAEKVWRV